MPGLTLHALHTFSHLILQINQLSMAISINSILEMKKIKFRV